ncbi:T9SS type A sorting domain-containing protein [Subsaximicrobium wynnwilliamsii]|uniref:T9SS type A sorting domain-containing protein n=1 Tax=Subsaximicrobium wynnwilliamsii TaxID=291179 RepID=A0A5C6ZJ59_9FLAO|nr:T9SS type A sorting domain-containing protein [Subsaximicrobium wynnwilliamsii]TXD84616.1 T9SS type A sorting domain-containing protein [Subsaximicrobium wynnwilliamsii]TXD90298.1 T9SS type A sorting domain-containing protein [Subsaximicrobium wynnwilliamsii]TXE04349.1 T9SS type A sorting domain-containing protein [Subsaximicrobium wynnwilliamsii]
MKTTITLLIFFIGMASVFAQDPAILWQNTIGGSASDEVLSISPTSDGGYILGGESLSNISGDKTEDSNGSWDIWIVKTNETGALEWEKTIGGNNFDGLGSICQTDDGGYLVTADSDSNISGDKTENSNGSSDYWILKLDATGTIVWQHTYGGGNTDYGPKGLQTIDGGYMVVGSSNSGVSGDKTDPSKGEDDIWVLKLDQNGAIVWQKTIGGNSFDIFSSIAFANDGGYIINTASSSNISGNKSENVIGSDDYWVINLSAEGNVRWDKTLGGTELDFGVDAIATLDGGFLVGGYSNSPISGNKSEDPVGDLDYWVVKLDSDGALIWDRTLGRNYDDLLTDIVELEEGSFLITGSSEADGTGNRTEPSMGLVDNWFVNLNALGVITGQKIIGGDLSDFPANVALRPDGGFVVATTSNSNIAGDKMQASQGAYDYWIYKMDSAFLGLIDIAVTKTILCYPNPNQGNFKIDLGKTYAKVTFQITDITGKIISTSKYASVKTVEMEFDAPAGIYLVDVSLNHGGSKSFKIIKY